MIIYSYAVLRKQGVEAWSKLPDKRRSSGFTYTEKENNANEKRIV